jgi:predicted NAD/FAD-dependent oxidoreductase
MGRVSEEPSGLARYVGFPKMSVLARDLLDGATLSCAERVEKLERTSSGWSLHAETSRDLGGFDIVVLAAPAAQTEVLLREGAGRPETIALADRIRGVEVDPCHAVMVRFAESLGRPFDAAFVDDPALAWIARGGSKPGRPGGALSAESWLLHSTPEWSLAHVEDDPESVGQAQLDALAKQLGGDLPEVVAVATHRWLYSRTRTPLGVDAIWEPSSSIGLCGDWLRGARVEDAFESGRAVATAICQAS